MNESGTGSGNRERVVRSSLSFQDNAAEVLRVIAPVTSEFAAAGRSLYLVGGVVRDVAIGSHGTLDDIDLTTDARPEEIKRLLAGVSRTLWTQGERFGTIGTIVNGRDLEITTHRAESYDPDSRKPMVVFGDDLHVDLSRRDFSINAMAYSVIDLQLHDPFGGMDDLAARLLRTPENPVGSFVDDPLRMLRAARFIPRFELSVDPELEVAVEQLGERLDIVSRERVHDELERLLAVRRPALGFAFLRRTGLLAHIVPHELREAASCDAASSEGSVAVRRAGLLASLTRDDARRWLDDLRYSVNDRLTTLSLLDGADILLASCESSACLRRLVKLLGVEGIPDAMALARNQCRVESSASKEGIRSILKAEMAFGALQKSEDLSDLGSPVSGGDLIARFGLEPGPLVGRAVQMLEAHRLQAGPFGREEAFALAGAWIDSED